MANDENSHGKAPPISIPTKICGISTRIPMDWICSASATPILYWARETSTRNEPKSDTAAITAEPIATPFVMALVVLPTASKSAMICWASLVSLSVLPDQAISPMPLALSEMGPNESIATLLPVKVNIPIPVMATPYNMNVARSVPVTPGMVPKMKMDATIVRAITSTDQTDDSKPTETPFRIRVAGQVSAAFLISLTGAVSDIKKAADTGPATLILNG